MSYGSCAAQRLANKIALITGASSGIGAQTALELADASNGQIKLILTARREDRLVELKKKIQECHRDAQVLVFRLDVSDHMNVKARLDQLPAEWSQVDILINNAGMAFGYETVGSINPADISACYNTNILGLVAVTQFFFPLFKKRNSGDFVNVGSIAGRVAYPGGSTYCATKAALHSFTDCLRKETIDTGIRVMEIQPGAVHTEFSIVRLRGDVDQAAKVYEGYEPLVSQDIAEVIVFNLTRRANTVIAESLIFPSAQAGPFHVHKSK